MREIIGTFLMLLLVAACATQKAAAPKVFRVMSYNVENLFDTAHDAGKLDYTYLPLDTKRGHLRAEVQKYCAGVKNPAWKHDCLSVDWNEEKLTEKIRRVGRVIRESTAGCPDVVVLQEIENDRILQRLARELDTCGYAYSALSDDRDERGIDVGILSKFVIAKSETLSIPFRKISDAEKKDSRGVLAADLKVDGRIFRVLGVHLPAPFHPVELRQDAVAFLRDTYLQRQSVPTLIAGDWNIPGKEARETRIMGALRPHFIVSDEVILTAGVDQGSTYYPKEGTWSFLDKILLARNGFDQVGCQVVKILSEQSDADGKPLSFPLEKSMTQLVYAGGISDHFPVLCQASY